MVLVAVAVNHTASSHSIPSRLQLRKVCLVSTHTRNTVDMKRTLQCGLRTCNSKLPMVASRLNSRRSDRDYARVPT
jgi:electron transfer flavoprotein alpha/beta subunit